MKGATRRGALCVLLAAAGMAALPASGAAGKPAHLRLISPASRVGVHAFRGRLPLTELGIELGALRAPLEIRVWRPRYSKPFRAAVVDARTGAVIHRIPRGLLASSLGGRLLEPARFPSRPPFPRLRGFMRVSFRRHGEVVARGSMPFCPSGLRERINGRGPAVSRYPPSCNSFSPFVRGLVWGIDRGWATGILDFGGPNPQVRIDSGRYRVTAAVARPYRRLFGMSHQDATVHLRAYVHGRGGGSGGKRAAQEPGSPPPDVPKVTRVPRRQRPDLVALPAWNIQTNRQGPHDLLTFSATEWNAGPAPLDVEGFRSPGHDRMRAFEYFRDRRGRVVGRKPAGHLEFDSRHGHEHWHFEQFARYTLVRNETHKVAASHKQSFCIAPTDLIDLTLPGADWMTKPASLATACGSSTSLWVREVMPGGWGDTYSQAVAGQAFNITHVPNGVYRVRVQVNPRGLLSEGNRGNDSVVRRVRLGGRHGHRTVHAAPWRGLDP